jgi:hypothetical protein
VYVCVRLCFDTLGALVAQTVLPEDLGLPVGFTDRKGAHALAVEAAKIARITALEGARFVVRALVSLDVQISCRIAFLFPWRALMNGHLLSVVLNGQLLWVVYLVLWCASLDVQLSCAAGRTDFLLMGRTHLLSS